jgi:hypothetical protein
LVGISTLKSTRIYRRCWEYALSQPFISVGILFAAKAQAEEKEPIAIVEIGGTGEWTPQERASSIGPSAAVEFTPIKDWLEIEAGTSTLFGRHTEWGADLLFKKPFTLSDKVEFMFGVGPEWTYTIGEGGKFGGEVALDFMFWPTRDRKFGWFVYGDTTRHTKSSTTVLAPSSHMARPSRPLTRAHPSSRLDTRPRPQSGTIEGDRGWRSNTWACC